MDERLKAALVGLEKPLRFATRSDAQLARVRELEVNLRAQAEQAHWFASPPQQARLKDFVAALPSETESRRLEKLRKALAVLETLLSDAPVAAPAPTSAQSSAHAPTPAHTTRPRAVTKPTPASEVSPLATEVQFIKGVGPKIAELFVAKGLRTIADLLRFFPRRYEHRQATNHIKDLREGMHATFVAEVMASSYKAFGGRRSLDVMVGDATGVVQLRWFRVPGQGYKDRFQKGARFQISGSVKAFRGRLQIVHPEVRAADEAAPATPADEGLVPIYPEIEGVRPAHMRRVMAEAVPYARALNERLPEELLTRHRLPTLAESVAALHKPPKSAKPEALDRMATPWHARLIYEELLLLELAMLRRKAQVQREPGLAMSFAQPFAQTAASLFSFALTGAQSRTLRELESDLKKPAPMQRLVQGDVGSGKTAVALTAAAAVARAGYQAAIMAPTELLAEQHARTALKTLVPAGFRVDLLTGSISAAERRKLLGLLQAGAIDVLIGTHALIQDDVRFKKLALAIVDEQHRFGVLQRAKLLKLGQATLGKVPHMLVMTATPIPRTLALTAYGDLDLSIIDELPPGRTPIKTHLFNEKQRSQVYARVRQAVEAGRQAYVVFPLVEESEGEGYENVKDATSAALELSEGALKGISIGLLHGRLSQDDKDRIMRAFSQNQIQVLVSTTVIEVGIDVPNATVMVIEHAERFGLSQLHQLRGRVGRGAHESSCLLVASFAHSDEAWQRLRVMEETTDGFRIAEADLEIRGPGDFLGTRQAGEPMLSLASIVRDQKILLAARADAEELLARDPELIRPEHAALLAMLKALFAERAHVS